MTKPRTAASDSAAPPRLRLRLQSIDDLAAEAARVYRQARAGALDVSDASKLVNMLSIMQRMIQGGELEQRIERLEEQHNASIH